MLAIPSRIIATCFALAGFAAAVLLGWGAQNSTETIILRATLIMFPCWIVGRIAGHYMQQSIVDHIERYKLLHPIEDEVESPLPLSQSSQQPSAERQADSLRSQNADGLQKSPQRQVA